MIQFQVYEVMLLGGFTEIEQHKFSVHYSITNPRVLACKQCQRRRYS